MTTDMPIYRLVRCPKCRLVLPELADLPLYKCGGCGTVLQAKRRKDAGKSINSSLCEKDASLLNSLNKDPEDKESSSSSCKASCASSGECSLDHDDQRDCTISGNCDNELLGSANLSNDQNEKVLEQNDLKDCSFSGDSDNEQLGGLNLSNEDQNNDFLEQNDLNDFSISGDSDSEQLGGLNLSNDDQNDDQNDLKVGLSGACDNEQLRGVDLSNEGQNDSSLEQNDQRVFSSGACDNEQLRGVDLSSEDHSYEMHHNESYERNIEQNGVPEEVCSPVDLSPRHSKELSPLAESNTEVDVNDENSSIARANSDVESNDESNSTIKRSSTKKLSPLAESNKEVDVNDESSPIARAKSDVESNDESNSTIKRSSTKKLSLAESNKEVDVNDESSPIARGKSDVESNDESNSTIKRSSTKKPVAINGMRQVVTPHATAREIISSDMLLSSPTEQREHSQEGIAYAFDRVRSTDTLETTDFINPSSELSGKLIDLSKSPTTQSYHAYYDGSSFDEMDDQSPNHYRHSFDHHKMHEWNQDELQKPIGLGYRGGRWRSERDEYPSWLPSYQRGSPIGFESGSPSNQFCGSSSSELRNEFHCDASIHLRNKHESEQEKRKLLRMVNDLQDQLNRAYSLNEEKQRRNSASIALENHMPMYHDHKALEEQGFYNLNYPMFPGRVRQESKWSQQSKFLHKPFSGEATYGRHHMDSCLCLRPSDWQNSAQLPPFGLFHNKGRCRIHPSQNFHTSYGSCPSGPQLHLDSGFPLHSRETKSDNQRHKDDGVKQYLREKHYSGKKHLRPIAGAAPLITCHHCLKQLQLPADFLIFRRRCHRLRCGSCSEVIKFSVKNRTHLVPYSPDFKDPPPSEIGECSDTTDRRNLASASHPSESLKVGPVSYSDDYSFSKSCSSDVDPASFTPLHPVPGNAGDRKIPSYSLKIKQDRKKSFSKESQTKNKNPVEGCMSAEPSASTSKAGRMSSEIEKVPVPPRSTSPLHRLMGYSSPSEVIKGSGPAGSKSRRS